MVLMRPMTRAAAVGLFWAVFGLSAQAQLPAVTAESACQTMPKQPGVSVTTPTAAQLPQCKVDPIPNPQNPKAVMGYVVRDAAGKPVRQFVSYDGKSFNILAFYLDGVEAYREVYPPQANEPSQFRWLGPNGSKWGVDRDRDGRIDEWVAISPEEASQELLQAVLTRDAKRAEALGLTRANVDALGIKGAEADKLLARAAGIGKKVMETAEALKANPSATWDHLELTAPQTTPADALGARDDLVVYKGGAVLVKDGNSARILQTGEMVQIGRAWKLIDGPGGSAADATAAPSVPQEIAPLVAKLNELDQVSPTTLNSPDALAAYNASRVVVLEQIVAKLSPDKQETWLRLLIDALSAAAEGEKADGKHIKRLREFRDSLVKGPNASLAAFAAYRLLTADNNIAIAEGNEANFPTIQEKWRASLEDFYKAYPNSDEAPEALLRLGMAYEYQKDGDAKAKEWYGQLAGKFASHPNAAKAKGAIKRLDSDGKLMDLTGANLVTGQPFGVSSLQGKVVVVYYCAGWSRALPIDAKTLQGLMKTYGPKGLEVVSVCLDGDAKAASESAVKNGIPGIQLFAPGGLDASPLASAYGILVVPHVFIVGKDGKVVNRNAHVATLEEDLKKLLP